MQKLKNKVLTLYCSENKEKRLLLQRPKNTFKVVSDRKRFAEKAKPVAESEKTQVEKMLTQNIFL